MSMCIVSITGKTGSGKSYISKQITKSLGDKALYIDVDVISRSTMNYEETINQAINIWGESILDENGKIDRKKFRHVVFSSKENRDMLTKISLPLLVKLLLKEIENAKEQVIILDWAFTPDVSEIFDICDIKVLVRANESIRRKRILIRDNLTEDEFIARDHFSMNYDEKGFDIVINNDKSNIKSEINKICYTIFKYL